MLSICNKKNTCTHAGMHMRAHTRTHTDLTEARRLSASERSVSANPLEFGCEDCVNHRRGEKGKKDGWKKLIKEFSTKETTTSTSKIKISHTDQTIHMCLPWEGFFTKYWLRLWRCWSLKARPVTSSHCFCKRVLEEGKWERLWVLTCSPPPWCGTSCQQPRGRKWQK